MSILCPLVKKLPKKPKNRKFTKIVFLTILNGIWEVWGCPGAWHGPCEPILSKFGGIWSYMARFSHGRFFSWPILLMADSSFFVPETLDPFFLKIDKDAHRKMIEIRQIKSWFGQLWCHLVSNRIPVFEPIFEGFWAQKLVGMENQGNISFFSVFIFHGFPMDFPWISHWVFHGFSNGFCIRFPMDFPWIDFPWFFHELQNVSVVVAGTPPGVRKQSRHRHIKKLIIGKSINHLGIISLFLLID